jgi:hypothetical protein
MMLPDKPPTDHSDKWTYGITAAVLLLVVGYFVRLHFQADPLESLSPQAQVEARAAERMAGVRCIGARASSAEKEAIARMLAVNTVAPRGVLPPWLPASYSDPDGAPAGNDVWQALAKGCAHAPAFGTPFGFPSADVEKELRNDPEFAAVSDRQWAAVKRSEAAFARQPDKPPQGTLATGR